MLNKIIKRGHRKVSKGDESGFGLQRGGNQGSGMVSNSNDIVNHASQIGSTGSSTSNPLQPSGPAVLIPATRSAGPIEALPMFKDVQFNERPTLFIRKLQICCHVFDFTDTLKSVREKEIKSQSLLELIEFIQSGSGKIHEIVQEEMIKMVYINIFRSLPPAGLQITGVEVIDPDEEEPYLEPSWTHLQFVYELFLRYVVSQDTDAKAAKKFIDHVFVLKLPDLFDSEDRREREYLKTILHIKYWKFHDPSTIYSKGRK